MQLKVCVVLTFFFASYVHASAELTIEQVLQSTKNHFPLVLDSLERINASRMKVQQAEGAFDSKFIVKGDNRTQGFYDGKSVDALVVKPLQFMNTKFYGGFRVSDGDYPVYEGKLNTLDEGETRAGIAFSLIRNRAIDEKRVKIWNQKLDVKSKILKAQSKLLSAQKEAYKVYWEWVIKGQVLKVYQNLLAVAYKRDRAVKMRVEKGDLAAIYRVESQQYILKRKVLKLEAERELKQAALKLSLYFRSKQGTVIVPTSDMLPQQLILSDQISPEQLQKDLSRALSFNPKIGEFNINSLQLENVERSGTNQLKPLLDLNFEVSKDTGEGKDSLRPADARILLKFELPLERNLGKGKVAATRTNQRALGYVKKYYQESLEVEVKSIYNQLKYLETSLQNIKKEVGLTKTLQEAEAEKFISGDSDFFVVNLREQNFAEAQLKYLKAFLSFEVTKAQYREVTLNF